MVNRRLWLPYNRIVFILCGLRCCYLFIYYTYFMDRKLKKSWSKKCLVPSIKMYSQISNIQLTVDKVSCSSLYACTILVYHTILYRLYHTVFYSNLTAPLSRKVNFVFKCIINHINISSYVIYSLANGTKQVNITTTCMCSTLLIWVRICVGTMWMFNDYD